IGSSPGDRVGSFGITTLRNGNYVVDSPTWDGGRGAATWEEGNTGTSGVVSATNSLVGSDSTDRVGMYVTSLSNSNYLVNSGYSTRGAVTWGNGNTGITGTISDANSLVGSSSGDQVGYLGISFLSNGNYVVKSPMWDGQRGAATWGNGRTGVSGIVSEANSLIGSSPGDQVGFAATRLSNGNYVVGSPYWNEERAPA